jgi:hypothetical protein
VRAARTLLLCLLGFLALDAAVFHTRFYRAVLKPDSTAGLVESILTAEITRPVHDRKQVIMVGDSRMGFYPRFTDPLLPELGYTFRTIGVAGSSPRCWYYLLREVDPTRRRYSAVLIPLENYDDAEISEDYANRIVDLNYLAGVLSWRDAWEFASSFRDPQLKLQALRGLFLKGLVYKRDFEDLLASPGRRWHEVKDLGPNEATWRFGFQETDASLKDVHIDAKTGAVAGPPEVLAAHGDALRARFFNTAPANRGLEAEYLHYWLTKICDYYQGSGTQVVFLRLPRGGFVRPDQPPLNSSSSVRVLSRRPGVKLVPEHFFDDLEHPELFHDEVHLNGPGNERFSIEVAREVSVLLGRG